MDSWDVGDAFFAPGGVWFIRNCWGEDVDAKLDLEEFQGERQTVSRDVMQGLVVMGLVEYSCRRG